jgi:hypothetical protein
MRFPKSQPLPAYFLSHNIAYLRKVALLISKRGSDERSDIRELRPRISLRSCGLRLATQMRSVAAELFRRPTSQIPIQPPATKQPDGQITKTLSIPSRKNISLPSSGKSVIQIRASHPIRGALRTSRTLRWDAVDAGDGERRTPELADGEVVWSWRPDAGVKLPRSLLGSEGGKKARSPGRARSKP